VAPGSRLLLWVRSLLAGSAQYVKRRFMDEGREEGMSPERLAVIQALASQPNTIVYVS
jgi:hypothetical protein